MPFWGRGSFHHNARVVVARITRACASHTITSIICDPGAGEQQVSAVMPKESLLLQRSFCRGSFDMGGRFYGLIQHLDEDARERLLIDGEPVAELDFSALHTLMLYHEDGID